MVSNDCPEWLRYASMQGLTKETAIHPTALEVGVFSPDVDKNLV